VPVTNALTLVITYLCDVISRPKLLNSSRENVNSFVSNLQISISSRISTWYALYYYWSSYLCNIKTSL